MITKHDWVNNAGVVVFRAVNSFTRAAEKAVADKYPPYNVFHQRVGRFSIVRIAGDVLAAPFYTTDGSEQWTERRSEYFQMGKRDRLQQLAEVERDLHASHPHAAELRAAIVRERAYYMHDDTQ